MFMSSRRWRIVLGVTGVIAMMIGATRPLPGQGRGVKFGEALSGILPAEFERFRLGLNDFLEVETAEEGLGPAFNAASCAGCHNVPAVGGGGDAAPACRRGYRARLSQRSGDWRGQPRHRDSGRLPRRERQHPSAPRAGWDR